MAMMGLDGGRINIGTCSIGAATRAFDVTREYVQASKHSESNCGGCCNCQLLAELTRESRSNGQEN